MEVNSKQINTDQQRPVQENVQLNLGQKVKSIKFVGYEDVYNMEVKDHHNFAVEGGFIVHNCIDAVRYALNNDMTGYGNMRTISRRKLGI